MFIEYDWTMRSDTESMESLVYIEYKLGCEGLSARLGDKRTLTARQIGRHISGVGHS